MHYLYSLVLLVLFNACIQNHLSNNTNPVGEYNVVWESPSNDHNGSMPIGNGDIGLNVWVEQSGDLCFYIGKTDSWGDNGRLLKVGKVRVQTEPALVFSDIEFKQELDLNDGTIRINVKGDMDNKPVDINLNVWVDANNPVIHIDQKSTIPLAMKATIERWRTKKDTLPEIGVSDLMENRDMPGNLAKPVIVEPDNLIQGTKDYIGWYHHNQKSEGFDLTNKLQGLSEYFEEDPILHRTFGGTIKSVNATKINDSTLVTPALKEGSLSVHVLTSHPSTPEKWTIAMEKLMANTESISLEKHYENHKKWWNSFWDRSWIKASPSDSTELLKSDNDAFLVSRAYNLQRFIDASAGRGNFPIKFNGSLFTVPSEGMPGGPDYRRWGPGYWWQNTRLPYLSMTASGDFDLMKPLFKMYVDELLELSKYRTEKYFGFEGAYMPECMYFWGSVFTADYGWTPYEERIDPLQESGWHKWEWVSGPELVFMMLDYYDYTEDKEFLQNKIIPTANEIIKFFNNYYETNDNGKLVMYPSMAAETWWDCTNPMPELSGLHGITKRLMALPEGAALEVDRKFWKEINGKLADIPLRNTPSGKALAPAERFEDKRNVENPELYAVFPFRLYGIGNPNLDYGLNALKHRWDKGAFGWRQDDIFMAYLGLSEQAKENIVERTKNYDKNSRFPAFWGPNYDWTPDQDHGGVLMKTFQSMLMQVDPYSSKIYLLPAWPIDWNAEFKLHAPQNTVIEGRVVNGEIKGLKVTPASRKDDIVLIPND
ncbi:DUF5703 domain-containing protein [Arenibacter certesii]|nr:DUF5703 domain-containing protein [Arenibacter certesii]